MNSLEKLRAAFGDKYHIYYSRKFGALPLKGPTNVDPIEADTADELAELLRADYQERFGMEHPGLDWQHPPTSNPSGNCPEYADLPDGGKAIRSDRNRGAVLELTAAEWDALRADVTGGLV